MLDKASTNSPAASSSMMMMIMVIIISIITTSTTTTHELRATKTFLFPQRQSSESDLKDEHAAETASKKARGRFEDELTDPYVLMLTELAMCGQKCHFPL